MTRTLLAALLFAAPIFGSAHGGFMSVHTASPANAASDDSRITMPGSPFGIANGFLYGYQGTPAYDFMPAVRRLGAGFTKTYLFWNQIEPKKGTYDWTAVDAFVNQLKSPDEGLVGVFSASEWAVTKPAPLLPPSPAKNPDDYYRFIFDLVSHCKGRVRYWQNDAEPNSPIYWSGTKEEFVAELALFHKAVKAADPSAVVVVGGYDGLFGPPGTFQFPHQEVGLAFFDYVMKEGRDAFDVFDMRLYGDPYTIVARVDYMRAKMRALGYDKPIICTEYGGPNLFEFPANRKYIPLVAAWSQGVTGQSTANGGGGGVEDLYKTMSTLAPETQMFMQGCPPELDAKYQRIQARGIVARNLFALSAGVQKTIYWYLPADAIDGDGRFNVMTLMYGKIGLVTRTSQGFTDLHLGAEVFQRMTTALQGVERVTRVDDSARPSIVLFRVDRGTKGPAWVAWERRDAFSGEDAPAVTIDLPVDVKVTRAVDAFGRTATPESHEGRVRMSLTDTPIFLE
jgi:hypothetical protein